MNIKILKLLLNAHTCKKTPKENTYEILWCRTNAIRTARLNIEDNSYKNNTHILYKRNTIPESED